MTKQELFKKYSIDEGHSIWSSIDSYMTIEIYRIMHKGQLPREGDGTVKYVVDFLDKEKNMAWWTLNVMRRDDFGSLYLTAKRMVWRYADQILDECNF
jgi:hypothetical protein